MVRGNASDLECRLYGSPDSDFPLVGGGFITRRLSDAPVRQVRQPNPYKASSVKGRMMRTRGWGGSRFSWSLMRLRWF